MFLVSLNSPANSLQCCPHLFNQLRKGGPEWLPTVTWVEGAWGCAWEPGAAAPARGRRRTWGAGESTRALSDPRTERHGPRLTPLPPFYQEETMGFDCKIRSTMDQLQGSPCGSRGAIFPFRGKLLGAYNKNKISSKLNKRPVCRIYTVWVRYGSWPREASEVNHFHSQKVGLEWGLPLKANMEGFWLDCDRMKHWCWSTPQLRNSSRSLLAGPAPQGRSSRSLRKFYKWDDQWKCEGQTNKHSFLSENVSTAPRLENNPRKIETGHFF